MIKIVSPVSPTIMQWISHHSSYQMQHLSPSKLNQFMNIKDEIAKQDLHSYMPQTNFTVFDPKSYGLILWHSFLVLLVFLQGLYFPILVCFTIRLEDWLISIDFAISAFFIVDILIKFNTAYFSRGFLITQRIRILKHYIKDWFFFDILVNFPYNWLFYQQILYFNQQDSTLKKTVFCLQWIRLARFLKLKKMMNQIEFTLNSQWVPGCFKNTRIFSYVFFLIHWNACIWYLISSLNIHPDSWLHSIDLSIEPRWIQHYTTCLYWSLTTLVTVGYGDISAGNIPQKITSMASMGIASALYGVIIGKITSTIIQKDQQQNRYRDSAKSVDQFLKRPAIPLELKYRVRSYMNYLQQIHSKNTVLDQSVLQILSQPLKDQIAICINTPIIIKNQTICVCFNQEIIMKMSKISHEVSYAPEDIIFARHQLVRKIYFLIEGGVKLYLTNSQDLTNFPVDGVFGELGFFLGLARTCSAKSNSFTTLMYLDYQEVKLEFQRFPNALKSFERINVLCQDDYEFLGIKCFLCGKIGHVVIQCPDIRFFHHNLEQRPHSANPFSMYKRFRGIKKPKKKHLQKRFNKLGQTDHFIRSIQSQTPKLFETISFLRDDFDFRARQPMEVVMDDIISDD